MKKNAYFAVAFGTLVLTACNTASLSTAQQILNAIDLGATGSSATSSSVVPSAASTGADVIGGMLKTATSGNNLANIFTSVIGLDKVSSSGLIGTWKYSQPGVAFTSQSTLANAGGEVVAATVKEKLTSAYKSIGVKKSNTSFTFKSDGTFTAQLLGKSLSGTYTFDENTQKITLQTLLVSITGYTKKNSDGIALLFESKKILTVMQTLGSLSGNSTVSSITSLASNYDGVRVGFDMTK